MTHQPADGESGSCTCDQCGVVLMSCDIGATCRFCGRRAVAALAAAAEQLRQKDEELKRLGERLAAAERLLDRAWVAKQSFWYHDEVCIHHPFFSSGWVARKNPLLIGRKGTTGAEALSQCDPHQFNGWGFDNPIDAYLAAVAANWLPAEQQTQQG